MRYHLIALNMKGILFTFLKMSILLYMDHFEHNFLVPGEYKYQISYCWYEINCIYELYEILDVIPFDWFKDKT